jgi:proteasome alpha subunit
MTEPSGQFMPYQAVAIGQGGYSATEYLEKNYREDLNVEETVMLALNSLKATLKPGEKLSPSNVEVGYATRDTGLFRKMSLEERTSYLQKLG